MKANLIDVNKSCLICVKRVDLAVIVAFNGQADITLKRENNGIVLSVLLEVCIFQPKLGHTH